MRPLTIKIFCFIILFASGLYLISTKQFRESTDFSWMDKQIALDFEKVVRFKQSDIIATHVRTGINLYTIQNGKILGPKDKMYNFLKEVIKRYQLPNLSFLYATQDIIRKDTIDGWHLQVPIMCSAKAPMTDGIIIHFIDWYFDPNDTISGFIHMIKEIDSIRHSSPWGKKINTLFWRGAVTDCYGKGSYHNNLTDFPRGILVNKSLHSSQLIDARFTKIPNPSCQKHFPTANFVSVGEHIKYKFQIAMDGETATYPGYQWRLYSGCVCLKQESNETMWYYGALIPWVHYVPISRNLSDLEDTLKWLLQNDVKAKEIADNAYNFSKNNLMPEQMFLYAYKVLMKYASLIDND
jgi:hypothetical protein